MDDVQDDFVGFVEHILHNRLQNVKEKMKSLGRKSEYVTE